MGSARRIVEIKGPKEFAETFSVSRETIDRLTTYEALLRRWQGTVNLVAASTLGHIWHRHFADSAQLFRAVPAKARTWLDLGSGAGFPGLVLTIMLADRGGSHVTLIESDTRKAAFLREVARQTGVAVDIFAGRIEKGPTQSIVKPVDCVMARALAPLPRLLDLAAPFAAADTVGLFLKGRGVEREIEEARSAFNFSVALQPSLTDPDGRIAVIRELRTKTEG